MLNYKAIQLYDSAQSSNDLRNKCKLMLQSCFQCCLDVAAMEPLLYAAPTDIVEIILRQLSKVLPNDASARRVFQTVGGLKKIQELKSSPSSQISTLVSNINSCYSEEVIKFYVQVNRDRNDPTDTAEIQYKNPKVNLRAFIDLITLHINLNRISLLGEMYKIRCLPIAPIVLCIRQRND